MNALKASPGVRTSAAAKVTDVIVRQADGTAASIGSSEGFWPEANDFVTTVDARFGRPGFPRSWPDVYSSSKALRRLLGKKGLQGAMSKTVDLLSKSDMRSEFPELVAVLRSEQSFDNALEVQRVKGWAVVKGFAVYDLHDCPEGEAYVGYRHWWNVNDDGAWVDLTPAEPGSLTATVQVRLLVETELGNKERKLLDYGVHAQALSLLQERERVEKEAARVLAMRTSDSAKQKLQDNIMEGFGAAGGASTAAAISPDSALMMAPEAERLVEGLRTFEVEMVGSDKWMSQHDTLTRLNLQAHHNVAAMTDEFVKEAFISFDRLDCLVHELLVVEAWKDHVFPTLGDDFMPQADEILRNAAAAGPGALDGVVASTNIYLVLYHESLLANLIEIMLFHKESLEALSSDSLLELVDYCHRRLLYLNSGHAKTDTAFVSRSTQDWIAMDKATEFEDKLKDLRFGTALAALSVLRYMTDYMTELPLGVMARMLDTHDSIMQLVPLLEERPWMRRRTRGTGKDKVRSTELFNDGKWVEVPPEERLKLSKADAQIWIALHNLVTDPKCRARYRYDDFRRETVTRLNRHFNDVLFDQIPMLQDLQRIVAEVVFMVTPSSADVTQGRLVIEQVPEMRDALLNRGDWKKIGQTQLATVFADTPENMERHKQKMNKLMQTFDFMGMMQGGSGGPDVQELQEMLNKATADEGNADALLREISNWDVRAETAKAEKTPRASKPKTLPPPQAAAPVVIESQAPARPLIQEVDLDGMD